MGRFVHLRYLPATDGRFPSTRTGNGRQRVANRPADHIRRSFQRQTQHHLFGSVCRTKTDRRPGETDHFGRHPAPLRRCLLSQQRIAGSQHHIHFQHIHFNNDDDDDNDRISAQFIRHFTAQFETDERNVGTQKQECIPQLQHSFSHCVGDPNTIATLYRTMKKLYQLIYPFLF